MNQGILLLKCWNGRQVNDWTDVIVLLRLVDSNIDYRSKWELIRRSFLYNYDIWMDIQNNIFICRDREPDDKIITVFDEINALRKLKYWDLSLNEYELTHSPEETLKYVRKQLSKRAVDDLGLND